LVSPSQYIFCMDTVLGILDFLVLLLLVIHVSLTVWKGLSRDAGSRVLTLCVAIVAIVFATVSLSAYLGLVAVSSALTRGVFLLVLIGMGVLFSLSGMGKRAV
jgi:hypothetical protein